MLDLQGAVGDWRLPKTVDSEAAWLRSDSRKSQQFVVAVRVEEIHSTTNVQEWRKAESEVNVPGLATKWGSGPNFTENREQQRTVSYTMEEEIWNVNEEIQHLVDTTKFSCREKLLRMDHRFIDNWKRRRQCKQLESGVQQQVELAETDVMLRKQAQQECYAEEVEQLSRIDKSAQMKSLAGPRSSHIFMFWPFLDLDGVMRKRGRIHAAYVAKYPTNLPQRSRISFLLADEFHRRFRRFNEMRQEYHIAQRRVLIGKTVKECILVIMGQSKWLKDVADMKEGDLVFIVDGKVRSQWVRGRVEEVAAGADGRVRKEELFGSRWSNWRCSTSWRVVTLNSEMAADHGRGM